jgi:hypothetical protein
LSLELKPDAGPSEENADFEDPERERPAEQPEHEAAFYRRRPDGVAERGGTAFMS